MDEAVQVVKAWQEAANRQDIAGVLARSAPDIVIVGPRGEARGHAALEAWLARAGLSLTTRQLYARGDSVVAEQRGVWRSPATGEVVGEADLATWFRVAGGRVWFEARYDQLAEALAAAGLSERDRLGDSHHARHLHPHAARRWLAEPCTAVGRGRPLCASITGARRCLISLR